MPDLVCKLEQVRESPRTFVRNADSYSDPVVQWLSGRLRESIYNKLLRGF